MLHYNSAFFPLTSTKRKNLPRRGREIKNQWTANRSVKLVTTQEFSKEEGRKVENPVLARLRSKHISFLEHILWFLNPPSKWPEKPSKMKYFCEIFEFGIEYLHERPHCRIWTIFWTLMPFKHLFKPKFWGFLRASSN